MLMKLTPEEADSSENVKDPFPTAIFGQKSRHWQGNHGTNVAAREGHRSQATSLQGRCPASPNGMNRRISYSLESKDRFFECKSNIIVI